MVQGANGACKNSYSTFCMVYSRKCDLHCGIFLYTDIRQTKTPFYAKEDAFLAIL